MFEIKKVQIVSSLFTDLIRWIVSILLLHGKNINIIVNTNTTITITTITTIQNLKTWTVSVLLLHAKNAPQGEKERENMEAVLFFLKLYDYCYEPY